MSRPLKIEINLSALSRNYQRLKSVTGGAVIAVLKANAYGHGALECARALPMADGFAVASIEEAEVLRAGGISAPILLTEGVFEADEWEKVAALNLWSVVHASYQLDWLEAARAPQSGWTIWLKMNSGMNRLGFSPEAFSSARARLARLASVKHVMEMTHFARADEADLSPTCVQWANFSAKFEDDHAILSTSSCNSAAIFSQPHAHGAYVRAGILLYGISPFESSRDDMLAFEPVMRVRSKLIAVQWLNAGDAVGYGGRFVANTSMKIGIVACGYADGYPRLATGAPIWVAGQRSQVLGRVSMDMLAVDLTGCAADVGAEVELWGTQIFANEVAHAAGTIAYELLCNIKRGQFHYYVESE